MSDTNSTSTEAQREKRTRPLCVGSAIKCLLHFSSTKNHRVHGARENMADHTVTLQKLGEQEDGITEKLKDFLTSSLKWSFAICGVKDLLINMQATFISISIALMVLFGISLRTTQSNRGTTFINFAFLILGCLVVEIAINLIILNPYIKWVIYVMFLTMVATNPNYQPIFQEMKRIFKSMCKTTSLRLRNSFIQSQVIIQNLLKTSVAEQEESSMNNNFATRPAGSDGGRVGEDIV